MLIFRRTLALLVPLALGLLAAAPAAAQTPEGAASADCGTDLSQPLFAQNAAGDARTEEARAAAGALTPAEERVQQIVSEKGIHVVRLWAPWCNNSVGEMKKGWDRLVEDNDDVSFTFVTVWNNGHGGSAVMRQHGLAAERVTEVVPADPEKGRLDTFMGYALNWVPSTWIFRTNEDGETERAFAMNYGEMERATLQTLIETAQADW